MRLQVVRNHGRVHLDRTLVHYRGVFLAEVEAVKFLESWQLLEDTGSVVRFGRGRVALEAKLLQASTVLNDVSKLADILNPVVSQVQVDELSLTRHVLDLPDKVVVQVELAKLSVG